MDRWQTVIDQRQLELTRLFLIDKWTLEQVRHHLVQSEVGLSRLTIGRLQNMLNKRGIYKNLSDEEVFTIKRHLVMDTTNYDCLIVANNILVNNFQIEDQYRRKHGCSTRKSSKGLHRLPIYVYLPFNFTALRQPEIFRTAQLLFYHAGVHFDYCFANGIWAPDSRGLYERTKERTTDLANLSNMHNKVYGALKEHRKGKREYAQALMDQTFQLHAAVVNNNHHRQFSDILAILLLIQQAGLEDRKVQIRDNLISLARHLLEPNDPRRVWFESLDGLPLDSAGHLYQAFEAFCRRMWEIRIGLNDAKSCYSYNQASFPRADPPGAFYRFFETNCEFGQIERILQEVDADLEKYSHETFTIWHMAIRFLRKERRYEEMERLVRCLCVRLQGLEFDYAPRRQLNMDASLTFHLLGNALEAQGNSTGAKIYFQGSVDIRSQSTPSGDWDPSKAAGLERLEAISAQPAEASLQDDYVKLAEGMYFGVMAGSYVPREECT